MKKYFLLVLFAVFAISCSKKDLVLTGKLHNPAPLSRIELIDVSSVATLPIANIGIDEKGNFLYHRRLQPPEKLTWRSFRDGMLVCHQAFYARLDIAKKIPFNTHFRYSADIDWCIKIMREGEKEGLLLRNVHAVIANYLEEGQTTKHHRASLYERFRVMCKHYGVFPTIAKHAWFVVRLFTKK